MPTPTKKRIDIDNLNQLESIDIMPENLDNQDLPAMYGDMGRDLSLRTTLALVQIELAASGWDTVKVSQIKKRHSEKYSEDTYRDRLLDLAEIGFLFHRKNGRTHEFRLPDECEPAAVFTNGDIDFTSKTDHTKFGPVTIFTDVLPEWFDNQYVSVGEFILTVVVVNLILLLVTGTFGPISESEPRVIFAWALVSFAISALFVGSVLLIFQRLQKRFD